MDFMNNESIGEESEHLSTGLSFNGDGEESGYDDQDSNPYDYSGDAGNAPVDDYKPEHHDEDDNLPPPPPDDDQYVPDYPQADSGMPPPEGESMTDGDPMMGGDSTMGDPNMPPPEGEHMEGDPMMGDPNMPPPEGEHMDGDPMMGDEGEHMMNDDHHDMKFEGPLFDGTVGTADVENGTWSLPISTEDINMENNSVTISADLAGDFGGELPPEVTDNGDGTYTIHDLPIDSVIDNGDGTVTIQMMDKEPEGEHMEGEHMDGDPMMGDPNMPPPEGEHMTEDSTQKPEDWDFKD